MHMFVNPPPPPPSLSLSLSRCHRPLNKKQSHRERRRPPRLVTRGAGGQLIPWGPQNDRKSRKTPAASTSSQHQQEKEERPYLRETSLGMKKRTPNLREMSLVRGSIIPGGPPRQQNPPPSLPKSSHHPVTPSNSQLLPLSLLSPPGNSNCHLKMFWFAACYRWPSSRLLELAHIHSSHPPLHLPSL